MCSGLVGTVHDVNLDKYYCTAGVSEKSSNQIQYDIISVD